MRTLEKTSIALQDMIVKKNALTLNELFFCRFLLPEKPQSSPPFILADSFKDESVNSLFLAIKSEKEIDISPVVAYKDNFNSLFLEISNVDLSDKEILPSILTLKKVRNESINTLPINTKVKYLAIDSVDVELSALLFKFTELRSFAVRNYKRDVVISEKSVPQLQCLWLARGRFERLFIGKDIDLHTLVLKHFPLKTLHALEELKIEELWIMNSEIDDFSPISSLPNLKKLYITNCNLNDLDFLKGKKLDVLDIHGTPMAEKELPQWLDAGEIIKQKKDKENAVSPNSRLFP